MGNFVRTMLWDGKPSMLAPPAMPGIKELFVNGQSSGSSVSQLPAPTIAPPANYSQPTQPAPSNAGVQQRSASSAGVGANMATGPKGLIDPADTTKKQLLGS